MIGGNRAWQTRRVGDGNKDRFRYKQAPSETAVKEIQKCLRCNYMSKHPRWPGWRCVKCKEKLAINQRIAIRKPRGRKRDVA